MSEGTDRPAEGLRVWRIADLLRQVRRQLEGDYRILWVEGEVVGLKVHVTSGHRYFELQDPGAKLPCVMWRSAAAVPAASAALAEGKRVRCRGHLTLWEAGGRFQMIVDRVEPAGAGDIAARIEELKRKLQAEGLTATERKRPLPLVPRGVGIVTSPAGAALHDVLKVLARRVPVPVVVAPCAVQGEESAASVAAAIERIGRRPGLDVVIVTRGGGSAQDLMAFNTEVVARAVAACPVPVISAVGHEIDVTVVDLVSDLRAATPSEAAERAVPTVAAVAERLDWAVGRCARALRQRLTAEGRALDRLRARLPSADRLLGPPAQALDGTLERGQHALEQRVERRRRALEELRRRLAAAHPRWRLAQQRGRLATLRSRLGGWGRRGLAQTAGRLDVAVRALQDRAPTITVAPRARLVAAAARLEALSPLGVLARGYALARAADGTVLTDAARVAPGDAVEVTLARGRIDCEVREAHPHGSLERSHRPC